jgi:hypothetical protein
MAMPTHAFKAATFTSTSGIDSKMDPKGVKLRESCDSDAHPESNAIIVEFDDTGSMGGIPVLFAQDKLPGLMKMLLTQNTIPHPQILFAAVGDFFSDDAPLQIGQFESGLEMDDWLTKLYLEGGGGGGNHESYLMGLYWAATHTKMDCLDKRGKKGYLFQIGDENYYPKLTAEEIKAVTGDTVQGDLTAEEVVAMAEEKFEVFRICVATSGYPDGNLDSWKKLLGQRAVFLKDPALVCEFIASQIASMEGVDSAGIRKGLTEAGLSSTSFNTIEKSLVPVGARGSVAKIGTSSELLPSTGAGGKTVRL